MLIDVWYSPKLPWYLFFLLPFSWLFAIGVAIRRYSYRLGLIKSHRANVPVMIVGNITVGGTGKTPFVIWLAKFLRSRGDRPGIVSRGVGGEKHYQPHRVTQQDQAKEVGDEALLLLKNSGCPVMLAIDRVAAVRDLLRTTDCNIIISDDGLQHYRLARDMEIAIIDGERQLGNQHLLPAGPLREPVSRLKEVKMVITSLSGKDGMGNDPNSFCLNPTNFISLKNENKIIPFTDFPRQTIHAVVAIGNPNRFLKMLETCGFTVIPHRFSDHYLYKASDLTFADDLPIIMTEKDAMKCQAFASERCWYLKVEVQVNEEIERKIAECLLLF